MGNPIFARVYAAIAAAAVKGEQGEHRRELLSGLRGRVVEVGAGSGSNFAFYPSTVTHVTAVEPEPYLRGKARAAAGEVAVAVTVVDGTARDLPLDDDSVDVAVLSLVLCSVPDPDAAVSELRRVLVDGGEVRFYEHVLAERPLSRRVQRAADATVWPRMAGGCHMARDTVTTLQRAGFVIDECRRVPLRPVDLPPLPHVLGRARKA